MSSPAATSHENRLARETSPYLLQHKHNPVDWWPWGTAALAQAKNNNKPILLSVGYAACHWCHVMAHESFEDDATAQVMNDLFVNIKVDREERPDIDQIYMSALHHLGEHGGWPLTMFLTPDGEPFWGGTYFPKTSRYGKPAFVDLLREVERVFRQEPQSVEQNRSALMARLSEKTRPKGKVVIGAAELDRAANQIAGMIDPVHGGMRGAPKFPQPMMLEFLWRAGQRLKDRRYFGAVELSLARMCEGGIYDHLGGGFSRYSVDERWLVPHFEKMCYDNSELLKSYVHAYQATGSEFFAMIARDIIRWMDEWLSDCERGGFYASQDADYSMDDDGDYFTWTRAEMQAVLTEEESAVASLHYDVNKVGEMHHNPEKNVLYVRAPLEEISKRLKLNVEAVHALLESARQKMYAARLKRPTPYVDKTVYVGWNSLCASAYLEAAKVLDLTGAKRFALRSLDRVLAEAWQPDQGLQHVVAYSEPAADRRLVPGLLDDYAFTAVACLDAYEATADFSYFSFAQRIVDKMVERFFDPVAGGFFDTAAGGTEKALGVLGTRRKPFQDSPTPAGNSVAAIALLRLYAFTNLQSYREQAEQTLELPAALAGKFGIFAATYGIAAVHLLHPHTQVIIVGEDDLVEQFRAIASGFFALNKTVLNLAANKAVPQNLPPALAETLARARQSGTLSLALRSIADLNATETMSDDPAAKRGETVKVIRYGVSSLTTVQK